METYIDKKIAEAYAAGLHDVNRFRKRWDRDFIPEEIEIEIENVVIDKSSGNPTMNMLKYIYENYEVDERTYTEKEGEEKISSYRILLLAHIASGFDSWVLLNSLDKEQI